MRGCASASSTPIAASYRDEGASKELPPQFIKSLHVLFDILDTSRTGVIHFEHLASKWRQLPTCGLPPNFLNCLQRVTPANGALDFSRFLAGVRLSLRERNAAYAPYQRVQAVNHQGRLHRVRSEGKLHDIRNTKEMTGRTATKNGPTMGVNALFPASSTKPFAGGAAQIQRRKEYRSQPDIFGEDSAFFDKFSSHSKENCRNSANFGNYSVAMRPKKSKNLRAPPPPNSNGRNLCADSFTSPSSTTSSPTTANDALTLMARNNRPNSINSISSSSGFSELQSAVTCPTKNTTPYGDGLRPQVAKHECLLAEEWTVVHKGAETTRRLQRWFQERVDSLEKRKSMLERGMVALDSAVHEQKLNFYRAQISDLTRRMISLMGSSEHGFPTHRNMNAPENGGEPDAAVRQPCNDPIYGVSPAKCAGVPRAMAARTGGSLGSSSASSSMRTSASLASTASRISTSSSSSPEPKIFDTNIDKIIQQQKKLFKELDAKSRLIEKLQREKRVHEQRELEYSGHDKPFVDTIRKPMTTNNTSAGERRSYLGVGKKLANDTLL